MKKLFFILISFVFVHQAFSQEEKLDHDTSYYEEHHEKMGLRLYFSKKYTDLVVQDGSTGNKYTFFPNSGNNLGLGFTYQRFTLNLAGPMSFLNPDRQKDFPKYLDLQVHVYPKNMVIDFFGQFYNGYTLGKEDLKNSTEDYLREDIKVRKIGFNFNYLLNGEKISLASAFNQSGIQKRSAMSLMAGFEVYGGSIKGDSLILPSIENLDEINFNKNTYFQFGPNVGWAGTLVFGKGFFLTGVANGGVNLGHSQWENVEETKKWGLVPSYILRGFVGYNGEKFSINANYVYKDNLLIRAGSYENDLITGNYRINFVYKIQPSENFRKTFNKFNPAEFIRKVFK